MAKQSRGANTVSASAYGLFINLLIIQVAKFVLETVLAQNHMRPTPFSRSM